MLKREAIKKTDHLLISLPPPTQSLNSGLPPFIYSASVNHTLSCYRAATKEFILTPVFCKAMVSLQLRRPIRAEACFFGHRLVQEVGSHKIYV